MLCNNVMMKPSEVLNYPVSADDIASVVRRLGLRDQILRRYIEEEIATFVPIDKSWLDQAREDFCPASELSVHLKDKGWTEDDLNLFLWTPEACRRYANYQYAGCAEEDFLSTGSLFDEVVYSLLRTRNYGMVRELWIRAEESEATFYDLAKEFGEGPESTHMGIIGPTIMGQLHPPQLADSLRRLQPGQIHPPFQLGEWWLLLRLERFQPSVFNADMKKNLL